MSADPRPGADADPDEVAVTGGSRHRGVSADLDADADAAVTMLAALQEAAQAGAGRLDEQVLADATGVTEQARDRLRLSAAHTIVALAGATGSGKSSLFNALTGLDLAAVGVKRPTTSWATACAWDPTGAADLLSWLGVPARHQVSRLSMLDASPEDSELEGLVLLDLPDHDSTEVSHHLEVNRLVRYADLIVWVLDPQKYADAALHERYLRPYSSHADVMFAVLNQVDRLDDAEVENALADVRRLLAADGLPGIAVLATSTVRGDGMPELRRALIGRLQAKEAARVRVVADVAAAAGRLAEHGGAEPAAGAQPEVREASRAELVDAVTVAAGLDVGAGATEREAARRARRAAGWPPGAMLGPGGRRAGTGPVAVDESLVDRALRDHVDRVGAGLGDPWLASVRTTAEAGRPALVEALGAVSRSVAASVAPPVWARLLGVLQVLLVLGALAAVGWQLAGEPPDVAGQPGGSALAIAAGGLALLLAPIGGWMAARGARARVRRDAATTRDRVAAALDEAVLGPVDAELAAHGAWCRALAEARRV